jgi:Bacterial DNA-binding protein
MSNLTRRLKRSSFRGYLWIMIWLEMKREQLARRLARESGITPAAAADQLDRILSDILKRVRRGQSASLPGLGTFWPGPQPAFYFEQGLPTGARRIPAHKGSK